MQKLWLPASLSLALSLALAGCGSGPAEQPTPVATAPPAATDVRPSGGNGVVASGKIISTREAQLSFTIPGRVARVDVALGDEVQPGDVLVALEAADLEAQVAQAVAEVQATQANLAQLVAGATPGEIAISEAAVSLAEALVSEAEAAKEGAEAQCAVAQSGIEAAQAALEVAQAQSGQLEAGVPAGQIVAAEAEVRLAEAEVRQAQAAYDQVKGVPDIEARPEALALEQATIAYEAARAQHEALLQDVILEEKQARVQVIQAEDQALATCAQVGQASAATEAARARQAEAEQRLSILKTGATEEEIAAASAQVARAEAALQVARVSLEQAELRAPFPGTIGALTISPGETVAPGQPVVAVADLSHLQVETIDLSERDVVGVALGQEAIVYVEALGEEIEGQVVGIAPQSTTIGGDVVYAVYVELGEQPPGLRWGMSTDVEIVTE